MIQPVSAAPATPTASAATASHVAHAADGTRKMLFALPPDAEVAIDLAAQTLALPDGHAVEFPIDSFSKHCLLNGLDEIGLTLRHADKIRAFEAKHLAQYPWLAR